MTSTIIVLGFDHEYGAEGMLEHLDTFQEEGLITLEDAVIASRGVGKNVTITQANPQAGKTSLKGSGVGLLAGLLLGGPILGAAAGAGIGAIVGSARDFGLDDHFVEGISESLKTESSALFLLVKEANTEELQGKFANYEAHVITTSLSPDRQKALQKFLEEK